MTAKNNNKKKHSTFPSVDSPLSLIFGFLYVTLTDFERNTNVSFRTIDSIKNGHRQKPYSCGWTQDDSRITQCEVWEWGTMGSRLPEIWRDWFLQTFSWCYLTHWDILSPLRVRGGDTCTQHSGDSDKRSPGSSRPLSLLKTTGLHSKLLSPNKTQLLNWIPSNDRQEDTESE